MASQIEETPLYHLLSNYTNAALTHGAWLAGFVVAMFTYMGLSLDDNAQLWAWGSFLVFFVLGTLAFYNYGRLRHFANLNYCIINRQVMEPFLPTTMYSLQMKLDRLLQDEAKKSSGFHLFYEFRESFQHMSVPLSVSFGLAIATALFLLRIAVLQWG